MKTSRNLFYVLAIMLAFPGLATAQACTITVSYFSGTSAAAVTAFQNSPSTYGDAMADAYLSQYGLTTSATVSNIVTNGTGDVNYDITYALPSASDTATVQLPLSFPFVIDVANTLIGTGQDPIIFTASVVSTTNTCSAPAPVPTLSQWGLIMLGLTFLCLGAIVLWRRQNAIALVPPPAG